MSWNLCFLGAAGTVTGSKSCSSPRATASWWMRECSRGRGSGAAATGTCSRSHRRASTPSSSRTLALLSPAPLGEERQLAGDRVHEGRAADDLNDALVRVLGRGGVALLHACAVDRTPLSCIVISASGMATGSRVLHHLEHQLPRSRNCVILTGYQVAGTRGRALADGATSVKIHGRYIPVRAEIANVRGYSAHADSEQMLSRKLHERLGWTAVVPRFQERVRLG